MHGLSNLLSVAATALLLVAQTEAAPSSNIGIVIKKDVFCDRFISSCHNVCRGLGLAPYQKYTCYTIPKSGKHVYKCTCGNMDQTSNALASINKPTTTVLKVVKPTTSIVKVVGPATASVTATSIVLATSIVSATSTVQATLSVAATSSVTTTSIVTETSTVTVDGAITTTVTHALSTTYIPTGITTTAGRAKRSPTLEARNVVKKSKTPKPTMNNVKLVQTVSSIAKGLVAAPVGALLTTTVTQAATITRAATVTQAATITQTGTITKAGTITQTTVSTITTGVGVTKTSTVQIPLETVISPNLLLNPLRPSLDLKPASRSADALASYSSFETPSDLRARKLDPRAGSSIAGWNTNRPLVVNKSPHSGNYDAYVAATTGQGSYASQHVQLEAGATYIYGCWMSSTISTASTSIGSTLLVIGGPNDASTTNIDGPTANTLVYKPVFGTFTAIKGGDYEFLFGWTSAPVAAPYTYVGRADDCAVARIGGSVPTTPWCVNLPDFSRAKV